MRTGFKRGLVLGLSACLMASSLAGCAKEKKLDSTAAVASLDGEEVQAGVVNFMLRYQQAQFESTYGTWLKSYYGDDIWNSDLSGTGTAYGDTFKDEIMNSLEEMLLAEKHMADYGVEVTDEEKAAITAAAQSFVEANGEDVLDKMSATQENVERLLTLYTIQNKMEPEMCADVDTEVSDEEAAQRTVSYVRFDMAEEETEAETEDASEGESASEAETEAGSEVVTEAAETENETAVTESEETETETAETDTEAVSEAGISEADADKTESADDETETETEAVETEASETEKADTEAAVTEAAETETAETETAADGTEDASEAESETEVETETETEDEATKAAKAEALAKAEAFLNEVKDAEDFATAAAEAADADESVSTSSYTFGDDDTYPDAAIITATKDLEDDTLVEEVINVSDSYYVLHVDDAFDEDATESKKEEIVEERKQEAIDTLYDEWKEAVEFTIDEEVYGQMVFDLSLMVETEAATEAETEAVSEDSSEASTEAVSEEGTEMDAEAATEEATAAEAETEAAAEEAEETETAGEEETVAETETETEIETETETK